MSEKPQIIKYANYNKKIAGKNIVCPYCKFSGLEGNFLKEYYETIIFDVSCPKCDKMLYVIPYDKDYEKYSKSTKDKSRKKIPKVKKNKLTNAQKSRYSAWMRKIHNLPAKKGEEYYSAKELAEKLNYNIMTIYRYIKSGKLKAYKISKEFRISKNDFDDFLNKMKTKK